MKLLPSIIDLINKFKSINYSKQEIECRYYSHDDIVLYQEMKNAFYNSFDNSSFVYYDKINEYEVFSHHICHKTLLNVFNTQKEKTISNIKLKQDILNFVEINRHYLSITNLIEIFIKAYHSKLCQSIHHHFSYHKNSFSKNIFYNRKHYNIKNKNKDAFLYNIYLMAFNSLSIEFNDITYNHTNVYINVYDYINSSLVNQIHLTTRHKKYNVINIGEELSKINSIENNGTPYINYFPFYDETKKQFLNYKKNNVYAFLLKANEKKEVVKCILMLSPKNINKKDLEDYMTLFFSDELEYINIVFFEKKEKLLNYLIYKLEKIEKCNTDILFSKIKILKKSKYLSKEKYEFYVNKRFNKNNFPHNYKYIDKVIKSISQN